MYVLSRICCTTIFLLLNTAFCLSEETDTVFHKSGRTYIGRIVEYLPEQSVSILTQNNDAFVVPWGEILRVARVTRAQTTSGRYVGPSKRRALDTTDMPSFMISGAGYVNGFIGYVISSSTAIRDQAIAGWGRGLNGVVAGRIGRTKYLGVTADYLSASFQNSLGASGTRWTGTATFWSVGPSLSFEALGLWFTSSLSYLHQRYDWDSPPGYPSGYVQAETREGIRLQHHLVIPVTPFVGIHGGARFDIAGTFQPNLMLGVSFCNFMDLLYHNHQ